MVRMENPSPIQVGREFVRQYYTLLNKAPDMLHRFYGVHSSYAHGSGYCDGEPEEGVIGQMDIHKKIASLKFKECHTKVRQVDAHATIGSGVVVQVIGELSNDRKPLRRFMQTFVLAPQAKKSKTWKKTLKTNEKNVGRGDNPYKFYVHNDIFRYEDEIFGEEIPQDGEQESEEEDSLQQQQVPSAQYDNPGTYYQSPAPQIIGNGLEQCLETSQSTPCSDPTQLSPVNSVPDSPPSGTQDQEALDLQRPITPEAESEKLRGSPVYSHPGINEDRNEIEGPATEQPSSITLPSSAPTIAESDPPSNQPFSWAALASKNTPAQYNTQQGTVVKVNQNDQPSPAITESQLQRNQPRNARVQARSVYREESDRGSGDLSDGSARRSTIRYPDNQQIFVGNLPYDITEPDLREHFTEFGEIMEIRINHSHTSNPSFGFIIFEDPKSVEEVLHQMPTTFKNNKRINIEEKKQRSLPRGDGRRGGGGSGGQDMRRDNIRGNRMQQRGPPRRERGGSREGQRPGNFPPRR